MNLEGRDCVVIGPANDREAIEKTRSLEEAGANVRWIRDLSTLRDDDVASAFFVISTPLDDTLSARLRGLADRYHFLLCCIDQPAYGFVAMQAVAKAGPARITVSTGGVSPAVSKRWRIAIQRVLDAKFARFMDALRARRNENRALADSEARKAAGREAAEGFDVQISVRYPDWFE
ncbi:MAG: NAD(P)-dependent oxidoreductase [Vulcanimicrobiaceae bacterium]